MFTLTVTLWVVWCRAAFLNSTHFTEFLNEFTFKVFFSLVRVDPGGHSKEVEPVSHQGFSCCAGLLVFGGDGLGVLGKNISKD